MDGEVLHVNLPSEEEVSKLVSTSEKQYKERLGMCLFKCLPGQFMNIILYYVIYSNITLKFLFSSPSFYLLIYILFWGIDIVFSRSSFENKSTFDNYNMTSIKNYSWIGCPPCYFCAMTILLDIFTFYMGFPLS